MGIFDWFRRKKDDVEIDEEEKKKPDFDPSVTKEQYEKAKKTARKAFEILAKSQGVKIDEKDYPSVSVRKEESTHYAPGNRNINILPEDINSGTSYFEESSHALRDLMMRRRGIPYQKHDMQVQEFYGRAGETLGRELTRGTELEYLFSDEKPRDLKNPETRKRWAKRLNQIRLERQKIRTNRKGLEIGADYVEQLTQRNYDSLNSLFREFERGKVSPEEFEKRVSELGESHRAGISNMRNMSGAKVHTFHIDDLKSYIGRYQHLNLCIEKAKSVEDPEEKRKLIQRGINFFREMYRPIGEFIPKGGVAEIVNDAKVFTHVVHREPYEFAQQYSAQQLLSTQGLYGLKDKEVRKRFFRRTDTSSGLENKTVILFVICFSLLALCSLVNINLTGDVIGGNISSENFLPLSFFIFIFLNIFFLFRIMFLKFS